MESVQPLIDIFYPEKGAMHRFPGRLRDINDDDEVERLLEKGEIGIDSSVYLIIAMLNWRMWLYNYRSVHYGRDILFYLWVVRSFGESLIIVNQDKRCILYDSP